MANPPDLPGDILTSIFGKLPLSSQSQAKAVSKDWKARLSSCKTRAKEGWIIVNCIDHLLWYNVDQNRWVKRMNIASLQLPLQNPRLCCVSQEFLFFLDENSKLCFWNAATNQSRLLEIASVPSSSSNWFGAYTDDEGKLKLLVHDYNEVDDKCKLFVCDVEEGFAWVELLRGMGITSPNFNNLTPSNRVLTFQDTSLKMLHLVDVDGDSLETLLCSNSGQSDVVNQYAWSYGSAGRFFFPAHGCFVVGESKFRYCEFVDKEEIGVLWYHPRTRKFELVSRVPEEVARSMREECGGEPVFFRAGISIGMYSYFFCSDGVENIWVLLPGCSRMLRFNVVSKEWLTLASVLPNRRYDAADDDPHVRALYTTF